MKKFIKNNLLGFILGVLVSGGVVYAATLIDSKDVTYTPSDSSFDVSNVEGALDQIYLELSVINKSNPLIPKMISESEPSGMASASTYNSYPGQPYTPYHAFDGDVTTFWESSQYSGNSVQTWLQYKFDSAVVAKDAVITVAYQLSCEIQLQASNDGTNWSTLGIVTTEAGTPTYEIKFLDNEIEYTYYRLYIPSGRMGSTSGGGGYIVCYEFQLYG